MMIKNISGYCLPSDPIKHIFDSKKTYRKIQGNRKYFLIAEKDFNPSLNDEFIGMADEYNIAGISIFKKTLMNKNISLFTGVKLCNIETSEVTQLKLSGSVYFRLSWAFNQDIFIYCSFIGKSARLFSYHISTKSSKCISITPPNLICPSFTFLSVHNPDEILISLRYYDNISEEIEVSPIISVSSGTKQPNVNTLNLIRTNEQKESFTTIMKQNIYIYNLVTQESRLIITDLVRSFLISHSGRWLLWSSFTDVSDVVYHHYFPCNFYIYDLKENKNYFVYHRPVMDGKVSGPRMFVWRGNDELMWVSGESVYKDHVANIISHGFSSPPFFIGTSITKIEIDNENNIWIEDDDFYYFPEKLIKIQASPTYVYDGTKTTFYFKNNSILCRKENNIYFKSIETDQETIIWKPSNDCYEYFQHITIYDTLRVYYTKESFNHGSIFNYYENGITKQIYDFNQYYNCSLNVFKQVTRSNIFFKRDDGIDLCATVYVVSINAPVIIMLYPEWMDAEDTMKYVVHEHEMIDAHGISMLYYLSQGYTVIKYHMPIIKNLDNVKNTNDTFIEQIKLNSSAIYNYVRNNISDKKMGIIGFSYGAFTVVNLLAHTSYFDTGIAINGAYNRTLTPFGFQEEERSLWDAKNVYLNMSPFLHLENINSPLLIIHGQNDKNPGTHPTQSERLFEALRGLGKISRLVILPHEDHYILYKESVLHVLHEIECWFKLFIF